MNHTIGLRQYQVDCIEAVTAYLREGRGRAPVLVMPTGSGKSHILAELALTAAKRERRVLVLTHRKELLEQNRNKLIEHAPALEYFSSFYSAGLREKDLKKPVVFAGVQSLCKLDVIPDIDAVLIDECHRVPPEPKPGDAEGQRGQYARVLKALRAGNGGKLPIMVGLSATPYRSAGEGLSGEQYIWDVEGSPFDGMACEVPMLDLVNAGYLAPLASVSPEDVQIDVDSLRTSAGEYTGSSHDEAMDENLVIRIASGAVRQMDQDMPKRRGLMVFTPTKNLTRRFAAVFRDTLGQSTVMVLGDTDMDARQKALDAFRAGEARVIVSCGVLTEGFDAPHVDTIVLARAIRSPSLFVQVCGRGSRTCEGKTECIIRDHGGNLSRHGPVNAVVPVCREKLPPLAERAESGGGAAVKLESITLDPSKSPAMLTEDVRWQRVVKASARLDYSKAGNEMLVFSFDLEGQPHLVREYVVIGRGGRSFPARKFQRLTGAPMVGEPAFQLATAQAAMAKVRRIACEQEDGSDFWRVAHVERAI